MSTSDVKHLKMVVYPSVVIRLCSLFAGGVLVVMSLGDENYRQLLLGFVLLTLADLGRDVEHFILRRLGWEGFGR